MDVPKFGTKGMFDLFAPGVFLWLNMIGVIYFLPWTDSQIRADIASCAKENFATGAALTAVFGYLIGVLLRLFRCERLDRLSARWLRAFDSDAQLNPHKMGAKQYVARGLRTLFTRESPETMPATYKLFAYEGFPFFQWVGFVCGKLYASDPADRFFKATWGKAAQGQSAHATNRQFFNFRKGLVSAGGGAPAADVYAAEALTRYMAGMLHALVASAVPVLFTGFSRFDRGSLACSLILLALAYFAAAWVILKNFRLIRIKEVEALFAADFRLEQEREDGGGQKR